MAESETRTGTGKTVHLCGVPSEFCSGALAQLSNGLKGRGHRCHAGPHEAFKCHGNYLVKIGYERLSSREYRKEGEPIRVLTKPCRFGSKMRPGKGTRSMPSGRSTGYAVTSL